MAMENHESIFVWRVIDKSGKTHHPLSFKSYQDLASIYSGTNGWIDKSEWRVVHMDGSGNQIERFVYEIGG